MMTDSRSRIGELELSNVRQVLKGQFRTSSSSMMTKKLEERFAEVFRTKYAVSFVNGTASLHAALAAAGVGKGDEVIVPPLTMASTSLAVLHANATPIFADVDPETWTIDPASIRKRTTRRTKAIVPVALYGLPPDLDAIHAIADESDLLLIEDDAECFLGYYKGRIVGSTSDAASFSFQSSKHMTSGEGGMVTTSDRKYAERIRRFGSLGYAAVGAAPGEGKISKETIQDPDYERHVSLGWNYRMPELCAAVALAQLERLPELVRARTTAARLYSAAIAGCEWLVPQHVPDHCVHSYWTYAVRLAKNARVSWRDFRRKYMELGGDGIYAAWRLTYLEPMFRRREEPGIRSSPRNHTKQQYRLGLCPVAESLQPGLLQLKTNYFNRETAEKKADALVKTIAHFDERVR